MHGKKFCLGYHKFLTMSHLAPEIWEIVTEQNKKLETVDAFKARIKNWKPLACPYRLHKTYAGQHTCSGQLDTIF